MAIPANGIDHRDSDNAHAWGDDETDVWVGRNALGVDVDLPRSSDDLEKFVNDHLPMGWLEESGVPISLSAESNDFKAMQGSTIIKTKITGVDKTFTMGCLEEVARVTELWWDHGKPQKVKEGEALIDLPASLKTINCWAILKFVDGDYWKIYVFPSCDITERGELAHSNTDLTAYQFTFKIKKAGWMLTNNPAYLEETGAAVVVRGDDS